MIETHRRGASFAARVIAGPPGGADGGSDALGGAEDDAVVEHEAHHDDDRDAGQVDDVHDDRARGAAQGDPCSLHPGPQQQCAQAGAGGVGQQEQRELADSAAAVAVIMEVLDYCRSPFIACGVRHSIFGAAADAVFTAVTSGKAAPVALVSALVKSADEGRLLYRSSNAEETALVEPLRLSGSMPKDNKKSTVLGVYVNDNTGSKKSYYLDMNVSACIADGAVHGHAVLSSKLTAAEAARLPYYITGPYFAKGEISTYMVLYGPAGTTLKSIQVDGKPAKVLSSGQHLGRPAVKVEVRNNLVSEHTIDVAFDGLKGEHGPLEIWHTPMTRQTPTTVEKSCGG